MKKTLLLLSFMCVISLYSQDTPPLSFQYDASGNQILSDLLCINCPEEAAAKQTLEKITWYPNPVEQELHLTWENTEAARVTAITLYTLNGKQLTSFKNLNPETTLSLPFGPYPAGLYIVELTSSKGEKKSLKILKK